MEPMVKLDPSEDSDQIASSGRRDSLPHPQPTLTTTTGAERITPPAGGAILTQEVRSPRDTAERRPDLQGGFQQQTQPNGNGVQTGSEFYEAYDMSIDDDDVFDGGGVRWEI